MTPRAVRPRRLLIWGSILTRASARRPDGRLISELGFLYHPSCRYNAAWLCLPVPLGNAISSPVTAGEGLRGLCDMSPSAHRPRPETSRARKEPP